jgi:iron(III) transport system substrate-binding protein
MMKRAWPLLLAVALLAAGLAAAFRGGPGEVTVYTSIDDPVARAILATYAAETGVRVEIVTDTESSKTVGLARRLLEEGAEGSRPRADVFWNNEPLWTVRLARAGVLEPYASPAAADIPAEFRDPTGLWTANGLRARILIVHAPTAGTPRPSSYRDLADPRWKGRAGMARPVAGTTLSHLAALRAAVGGPALEAWYRGAVAQGLHLATGNGSLAREVGRGSFPFGFTDTDDFVVRQVAGEPVEAVFPDQEEGGLGTFVLPVTVSVVRGAPHPDGARRLHDWLVSPAAEAALSATDYASLPVRATTRPGPRAFSLEGRRVAKVDWNAAADHVDAVLDLEQAVAGGK